MNMQIRPSDARGHARHGWLESRHTFSFANYFDPAHMGFSDLRVINEDRVRGGAGFPTHPHRDMEIISYVIDGALAHRDTLGTGSEIRPNEVQLMSAGRGIRHSEMNASATEPVHFLQVWIEPAERGGEPGYQQRDFGDWHGVQTLVSPDGRDDSLRIRQDAALIGVRLDARETASVPIERGSAWLQVVHGAVTVDGQRLGAGDGAALHSVEQIEIVADERTEVLVFDLKEKTS